MAALSTAEVATALETTPRTLRKFLRSDASPIASVGKGSRYAIEKKHLRSLKARFAKWESEAVAAATERETPVDEPQADADANA